MIVGTASSSAHLVWSRSAVLSLQPPIKTPIERSACTPGARDHGPCGMGTAGWFVVVVVASSRTASGGTTPNEIAFQAKGDHVTALKLGSMVPMVHGTSRVAMCASSAASCQAAQALRLARRRFSSDCRRLLNWTVGCPELPVTPLAAGGPRPVAAAWV